MSLNEDPFRKMKGFFVKAVLEKVRDTIRKHKMLRRGDTLCVAVSGGVDSTVLVHVLNSLKDEFRLTLVVCHLNHNLRGKESERDFQFVKRAARRLGLVFEGKRLKKGEHKKGSFQEWARTKRYEFLEEAARRYGARRVALGHNLDDQSETVLMRFIKGSGPRGLSGMEPVRGIFIRPLIGIKREEIARYAHQEGIKYVIDSSNESKKYLRNRLRLELIPFIEKSYNPNINETLARTARVLGRDAEYIMGEACRAMPGVLKERKKGLIVLDRKGLTALYEALAVRVFLKAAELLNKDGGLYGYHIDSFLALIKGRRPNACASLPGLHLSREYDSIILSTKKPREPIPFDKELTVSGLTRVEETGCLFKATLLKKRPTLACKDGKTAYFDYDAVGKPLRVRSFRTGDRMRPMGMGGHKKLKDLFIDAKIPRAERSSIPLVESGGEIIWAVGLRQAESFKVKSTTKRVLKITSL
jgi:tRNA(Ile)-lysidine synthase